MQGLMIPSFGHGFQQLTQEAQKAHSTEKTNWGRPFEQCYSVEMALYSFS
jgi:hypothetical protein